MRTNHGLDLVLPLAATCWATFDVMASTQKELNEIRDNIISNSQSLTEELSAAFRQHQLWVDWIPSWLAVIVFSLIFGFANYFAPRLVSPDVENTVIKNYCRLFSIMPFSIAGIWLIAGFFDLCLMVDELYGSG